MHPYWERYSELHTLELDNCRRVCELDECRYYSGECPNNVEEDTL